ncbi:ADP-ribosylglycohydrolase family protein [Sulfitobacter sp. JB4-11]|uniref:ADP-ribosylglycohydrolase family protein n=1 Tax=Sulfitobacter rhodophyticola TaxID=3238304 RepID=UPI0035194FD0
MANDVENRSKNMVLGALVADAATMGLHWIYDQDHIRKMVPDAPEFTPPRAENYDGVPAYFAHPDRNVGQQSQYGEQLIVMQRALAQNDGVFDLRTYITAFCAHFGYGGTYVGYIDHATRGSLDNYGQAEDDKLAETRGAVDVQMPAIAKLPGLIPALWAHKISGDAFDATVDDAVRATSDHPEARAYGRICAHMLAAALYADDIKDVIDAGRAVAEGEALSRLNEALAMTDQDTNAATKHFGMACDLSYGVPSVTHNLSKTPSFRMAVRNNIYAGGDNCGRAMLLGAILGALHGLGGENGIPPEWLDKLAVTDVYFN